MTANVKRLVIGLALALISARAEAASVCVTGATPAGGCGSTFATIQLAVNAAVEGDTVYLHAGTTYTEAVTGPDKTMTGAGVIIMSDTAVANLPAAGVRATMAHTSVMPIWTSPTVNVPAFQTAFAATSAAERYTLIGIWFKSLPRGDGDVILLGTNNCTAGSCQEFASQQADRMTIDRCVFTADPVTGQKRFVTLAGTNMTVKNSSFFGGAAFGQDSQAVWIINGAGPFTITNNHLESASENIMSGGDDSRIRTIMTVNASPAPTVTSANVTVAVGSITSAAHTLAEVSVGQHIAILYGTATKRCHTILRSKSGSGTTADITFDPCPAVPDVPGDIRAGVTPTGLTIRRNHFTKPLSWLNPIINAPTSVTATPSTASGTLVAGAYEYTVIAQNTACYQNQTCVSSSQKIPVTLSGTGKVTISWLTSANASEYRVYGRTSAGVTMYWTLAAGSCASGSCSIDDTGSAGTAATSVPSASYWQIKNLFEIKAAANVQIDSNLFEYTWNGSDLGEAIWIKSNSNSTGASEFYWSKDIVIEKNIFRHTNGMMATSGSEGGNYTADNAPGLLTNLTVRNNLVYDSGVAWALTKGGTAATAQSGVALNNGHDTFLFEHNTLIHTSRAFVFMDNKIYLNTTIRNNLALRNSFGIFGCGVGEGGKCTNGSTLAITANAIAGCTASIYPSGNFCPTVADFQTQFVNYTADGADNSSGPADYHLLSTSPYHNAATDGTDLGADISVVNAALVGVVEGSAEGTAPRPTITTSSLPNGTVSSPYTAMIQAQGAVGPVTIAVITGTLPTGLSLASNGAITGTPSGAGTSAFTVRATDTGNSTTSTPDTSLAITVAPVLTGVSITTTSPITAAVNGQSYDFALATSGGVAPFTWSISSGALPTGLTLNAATGHVAGVPAVTTTGAFSFTAAVVGALGSTATKALSVTVTQEVPACGRSQKYNNYFQYATFLQPTPPTLGLPDCTRNGDSWSDTSKVPPVINTASIAGGVLTWGTVGSAPNSHAMLSTSHSDSCPDTPQDGDLLIFVSGCFRRLGSKPGVLTNDGSTIDWTTAAGGGTSSVGSTSLLFTTRPFGSVSQWVNMPAVKTELNSGGGHRHAINLSRYTQARFWWSKVYTAGATGSRLYVEYSIDGLTWAALDGSSDGTPSSLAIVVEPGGSPTSRATPPFVITPGARTFVFVRVVGVGGDGAIDPEFGNIGLEIE